MSPHTIPLWLLRVLAALHAVMAVSQPLSIGQYLDGVIGGLSWHSGVGSSLIAVMMLQGALALVAVILRGSVWLLLAPTLLYVAETVQVVVGYSRTLTIHLPLGIAIVVAAVWYAIWLWLPRASRPRPQRPRAQPVSTCPGVAR